MRLIDADALKKDIETEWLTTQTKMTFNKIIDDAPTAADRYDEGYAQGYVDGSTGADWRGEE